MTKSPESVRRSRHATSLSLGTGNELEHPSSHGNGDLGMARLGGLVKMSVVSSVRRSTRPRHRALGQAGLGRHRPGRPVRGVLRRRLQRLEHHRLDPLVGNRARRPGRGSSRSPSSRSATNRARHLPTVPRPTSNSSATSVFRATARAAQHDPRQQRQRLGGLIPDAAGAFWLGTLDDWKHRPLKILGGVDLLDGLSR
jgi:hypothetical protein